MQASFSSSGPHHLAELKRRIDQFTGLWQSFDLRYSAVKVGETWYNLITDVLLSPNTIAAPTEESLVNLPTLVAGSKTLPIGELGGLLDQIGSGTAHLGGVDFRLTQPPRVGSGETEGYPLALFFSVEEPDRSWRPFWDSGRESVGFTAEAHGGSLAELILHDRRRELERQLLLHSPPYFGLDDLFRFFLRSNAPTANGGGQLSIRAPLYTWIEGLALTADSTLVIGISRPSTLATSDIRLLGRGVRGDAIVRFDVSGDGPAAQSLDRDRVQISIPTGDLSWVQGALVVKDVKVDEFVFNLPLEGMPNPRLEALNITDIGFRRLNEFVDWDPSVSKLQNAQPVGISWLLHLAGFQVLAAGLSGLHMGDSPDLIAFVPFAAEVLVIEVTTRDLSTEGKLVKLHDRADALREKLGGYDVVGVAVTSKLVVTATEARMAAELGLRVLTQGGLADILRMAEQNVPCSRVFQHLKAIQASIGP